MWQFLARFVEVLLLRKFLYLHKYLLFTYDYETKCINAIKQFFSCQFNIQNQQVTKSLIKYEQHTGNRNFAAQN